MSAVCVHLEFRFPHDNDGERERTAPGDISCESPPSNHPTNSRTCSFVKGQPLADVSLSQILFGQIEMIFFLCIVAGSGVFKLKEYPG